LQFFFDRLSRFTISHRAGIWCKKQFDALLEWFVMGFQVKLRSTLVGLSNEIHSVNIFEQTSERGWTFTSPKTGSAKSVKCKLRGVWNQIEIAVRLDCEAKCIDFEKCRPHIQTCRFKEK
jgi:hypothetical protein